MSRLENPIPDLLEASDALGKIVTLQTDLFILQQELKTLRQLKRTGWLTASLVLLNLLLTLSFYWLEVGLHEQGWSAYSLALLSTTFLGIVICIFLKVAFRTGTKRTPTNTRPV